MFEPRPDRLSAHGGSLRDMLKQTAQLLEAFEALPEEEKRVFTVEFLRRAVPFDSGPLDDEETVSAADELLGEFEAEENDVDAR